jgi:plastocyanin
MKLGLIAAAAGAAGLALAACGGGGGHVAAPAGATGTTPDPMASMVMPSTSAPAAGPAVATTKVTITNFAFMPAKITVKAGTTVTWTNLDEEPHTVVDGADGIKSPVLGNQGSTYSHVFAAPGTYGYNCSIHPFMHGVVVVTA